MSVEVDRDNDGELLIDWSPAKGRMLSMTLRDDGRLSYAFTWDGEQAHGTAQMPSKTCALCKGTGWALLTGPGGGEATCPDCHGESATTTSLNELESPAYYREAAAMLRKHPSAANIAAAAIILETVADAIDSTALQEAYTSPLTTAPRE